MAHRIVTPYSNAPSHELLKAVHDAYPICPWDEDSGNISDEGMSLAKEKVSLECYLVCRLSFWDFTALQLRSLFFWNVFGL